MLGLLTLFSMWGLSYGVTNYPNTFFSDKSEAIIVKAKKAMKEACDRIEDPLPPPKEGRQELTDIVSRFTDNPSWFLDTLDLASKDSKKFEETVIDEVVSFARKNIGNIFLILTLVIFLLGCWHWWFCCKCCRVCNFGAYSFFRMIFLSVFISLVGLLLFISGGIGLKGYSDFVSALDHSLCNGVKATDNTFVTMKNLTQGMANLIGQFKTFGTNSGLGAEINTILDDTAEIDISSAQFVSTLSAYEASVTDYKTNLETSKFECAICPTIASSTADFRDAFQAGALQGLQKIRESVKTNIQQASAGKGDRLDEGAAGIKEFVSSIDPMEVLIDISKQRDTFVNGFSAGVGIAFALSVLVLCCLFASFGCCWKNRKPADIQQRHKRVRRISSCGCCSAIFLAMLVFLLSGLFEIILFSAGSACLAIDDIDGQKLVDLTKSGSSSARRLSFAETAVQYVLPALELEAPKGIQERKLNTNDDDATNDKIIAVFDTCLGENGDGMLFDALKENGCPANLPGCTDDQKVRRSFRDMFVNDVVNQVESAFNSMPNNTGETLASSPAATALLSLAQEDLRQKSVAQSVFWKDPRFAMVTSYTDSASNPTLSALAGDTVKLNLHCSSPSGSLGQVYKSLAWFQTQLRTMNRQKINGAASGTPNSGATTCTTGTTLDTATCALFSATFNTVSDIQLATSLAPLCETKAAEVSSQITDYATFQGHINTVKGISPSATSVSATEITAITYLFGTPGSATGFMQCNPCRAGNNVLEEVKKIWGLVSITQNYNCPLWKEATGPGTTCDVGVATSCARVADAPNYFTLVDRSCNQITMVAYMTAFRTRFQKSLSRVDTATQSFGTQIQEGLFDVVNDGLLTPLKKLADTANCKELGNKVNNVKEAICFQSLIGLNQIDSAYLALGFACIFMMVSAWIIWMFAVKEGLENANSVDAADDYRGRGNRGAAELC